MVRTTKYLEDNTGESFYDLGLGKEVDPDADDQDKVENKRK